MYIYFYYYERNSPNITIRFICKDEFPINPIRLRDLEGIFESEKPILQEHQPFSADSDWRGELELDIARKYEGKFRPFKRYDDQPEPK